MFNRRYISKLQDDADRQFIDLGRSFAAEFDRLGVSTYRVCNWVRAVKSCRCEHHDHVLLKSKRGMLNFRVQQRHTEDDRDSLPDRQFRIHEPDRISLTAIINIKT